MDTLPCWTFRTRQRSHGLPTRLIIWWKSRGSLIPEMLAQSMMGYAIVCPDMIGGGEINAMEDQSSVDQEFFVRYAQLAALSPMMQFLFCPPASSTKRTTARSGMLLRHVNR